MKSTEADVERIAQELLEIYANRSLAKGFAFLPFPKEERVFRESFSYVHTQDQESAIAEILSDMSAIEPMDRLLSGDVGFGKTEVAMNAIYRAFLNHKQAIVISPLVVLAIEHFESLTKRLEPFGVNVAVLARVSTTKEEKQVLQGLRDGSIHCVVGTHRLLSPDVEFRNLGLLVIDEEHRFGVLDKEKLTALKSNLDILSLSATPIPRSLNLALNGVRKISVLTTPPPLKKAIKTTAIKYDLKSLKQAIEFEFERGGQVLFIHNRIATIETIQKDLEKLLGKKAKIIITHGQMDGGALEDRILDFKF
jgi:transcription-repair coupling factor (superfamily II helicase)